MYNKIMQIIDNLLTNEQLHELLNEVNGLNFAWYYRLYSTYENNPKDNVAQFVHIIYVDDRINSNYYYLAEYILKQIELKTKYKIKKIIRIKANLLLNQPHKNIEAAIHTDTPIGSKKKDHKKSISIIFYIEDSDGDTVVYKGDEIVKRISPKQNRAFIFPSIEHHNATPPKLNSTRKIINFMVEVE
jgi:hypothetical protein